MPIILLLFAVAVSAPAQETPVPRNYENDWAAFCSEVDNTYPFFELKGNRPDWDAAKQRLAGQVKQCAADDAFLGIVIEGIRSLRDAHMSIRDAKVSVPAPPREYYPGVSFMPATNRRVIVMSAFGTYETQLTPGTVVLRIDGKDARDVLEERAKEVWNKGFCSSPQRARMIAYRIPLTGAQAQTHVLDYVRDAKEQSLTVACEQEVSGWPHTYNMPADLARSGKSFLYGKLPNGSGYLYLRHVDADTEPGIKQAIEAYPDATGWVIDLRGNGGGGYDETLIERVKSIPRPVAVLIDAGCMSAGETLARDLEKAAEARLFGSRTAGASSAKRTWAFPSGIASVVFATRSRWRNDGQPIEFNGIEPNVEIEAAPEEVANGLNSEILRAQEYLDKN